VLGTRKLLVAVALAALLVSAAASAAIGSRQRAGQESVATSVLMPGVTYRREVDFTARGPIVLDVVTAPKPDGAVYSLAPALSNDMLRGTEQLSHLQTRLAAGATTVAVDGDDFNRKTGAPSGILMENGVLESGPALGRTSLGIGADGLLTAARVSYAGTWEGNGQRRPLVLNTRAGRGKFTLYTPAYGTETPSERGVVEAVIPLFPPAQPGEPLGGAVSQVVTGGPTPIPPHGAVIVARGAASTAQLSSEAPPGQQVEARLSLSPDWSGLASAIGGGPLLVRNGRPVFHANESFDPRSLNSRQPRAAIGQLPDGRILLVAAEGTNPAYSIGMSSYELAVELSRLGATTAFGLGSGPAAGIGFDGELLTRPESDHEAKLSDALVLSYNGAYAAPPSTPVLSPNGDGVGDTETLAYRVARPSTVVATLAGPGGTRITVADAAQSPGLHTFEWDGTAGGNLAPEGEWTFGVTAIDDRHITTSAQRKFSLDDTLSALAVENGRRGLPTATFRLTRTATVVARIERPNGVPVANVRLGSRAAGPQHVTWPGRIGRSVAHRGRYRVEVVATSSVGTSSLAALFSFRPHTRH
jgi:flagellar hook assembly protein FlgD